MDGAIAALERTTHHDPTRPDVWLGLAKLYRRKALLNKQNSVQEVQRAINRAMLLAPAQRDVWQLAVSYTPLDKETIGAGIAFAARLSQLSPYSPEIRWLLASLYHRSLDREDLAAQTANEAIRLGYEIKFSELSWLLKYYNDRHAYDIEWKLYEPARFRWLVNYYADRHDYMKVASLYHKALEASPSDYSLYERLAATYYMLGENVRATAVAEEAMRLNPAKAKVYSHWLRTRQ